MSNQTPSEPLRAKEEPQRWMVVRKCDTDPPEVWTFDRYDEAAMFWDRVQAQWTEVYFCRIVYGPYRQGMAGERPTVSAALPPEGCHQCQIDPASSRTCAWSIRGCIVDHEAEGRHPEER